MGEFAKNKINELADRLLSYVPGGVEMNWDVVLKEINLVGEPILRKRLFELYKEKRHLQQERIRDEISSLKKQLADMQKEIKELRPIGDSDD